MQFRRSQSGISAQGLIAMLALTAALALVLFSIHAMVHKTDQLHRSWGVHITPDAVCSTQYQSGAIAFDLSGLSWSCETGGSSPRYLGKADPSVYCRVTVSTDAILTFHEGFGYYCLGPKS